MTPRDFFVLKDLSASVQTVVRVVCYSTKICQKPGIVKGKIRRKNRDL